MYEDLAPIVLFVYNRPWHTKQTVEALQQNELTNNSELFIYSDGAKNAEAKGDVAEVRSYIKSIDGFKNITIFEREKNIGLAASIIDGVTKIVNQYGKIIVLEDDLITSPNFLTFMNKALDFYVNEKKVWHISGWNYSINSDGLNDVFLWRVMNCWGWGTWKDRWQHYEKNVDSIMADFSKSDVKAFNIDGVGNFYSQIEKNKNKKINTWAIFWYASIFKEKGLCLNPVQTFVNNIGFDGSGTHCGSANWTEQSSLNLNSAVNYETNITESTIALANIKQHYLAQKKNVWERLVNKLLRVFIRKTPIL
ncbi:hypothetical protein LCGC14_0881070 [marine sediment metagenome]|uniref:Uncharacterized protein n=1 Tax=marine sediment metagenome TaxID=412755 RepID=A0A0F9S8X6_9ZZZZ|nr:glycosyltransferase [Methylophaga sp.]